MVHTTSRKSRPTPLKDVQIALRSDEFRRYLVLDAHSSLPLPAYPFEQLATLSPSLQEDCSTYQVRASTSNSSPTCTPPCVVSHSLNSCSSAHPLVTHSVVLSPGARSHCWDNSLDSQDNCLSDPVPSHTYRSFTPPISPPVSSPPGSDTDYSSKRSGMTFALVPAEVDGKHVLTHVVVDYRGSGSPSNPGPPSAPSEEDGLPEDMRDMLRQLDDLASWVKAASESSRCVPDIESIVHVNRLAGRLGTGANVDSTNHPSRAPFSNKGKNRLLPTSPSNGECGIHRDLVESPGGGSPTNIFRATDRQSEEFIYTPDCSTPEFLVGSSNSPIAYPACGYSSHPSCHSPLSLSPIHDIPYHRRLLERRSAPCPPPTPPFVSPPSGKTSFKALFQRSRCNTTALSRASISLGHVPVEGALRQGKRMRLPWVKI